MALLSLLFLAEGVSLGGSGARLPLFIVLAWATVSTQLVAAAYLVGEPALFGKRPDGRLPLGRRVALLPYLVVAWAIRDLTPLVTREPAWTPVAGRMWVGRWVRHHDELPEGVGAVIDLTCEMPAIAGLPDGVTYVCVPTLDGTAPAPAELEAQVLRFVSSTLPLYIHCAAGHGRSALLAAALLVARGDAKGPAAAVEQLSRARPRVSLNADQRRALDEVCARLARAPFDEEAPA